MSKINYARIFGWDQLRKLNKVRFINTMYIWLFVVPIVAKLSEKVDEVANLTIFQYTFEAQLTLPFSWVAFYFSALAFALANLVFQVKCPRIIKEQKDYSDFSRANKGVEHLDSYLFEVGMNWEGLRQMSEDQEIYFAETAEVGNPKADDYGLRRDFWTVYHHGTCIRSISRGIAVILYLIGSALISIVFTQNTMFVMKFLLI